MPLNTHPFVRVSDHRGVGRSTVRAPQRRGHGTETMTMACYDIIELGPAQRRRCGPRIRGETGEELQSK